MSEFSFYGSKGFTQGTLVDRRQAFFGGPVANKTTNDLRRKWYANALGLTLPNKLTTADMERMYYLSIGGDSDKTLDDLRADYWSGGITPNPSVPTVVGSTHNGNNGLASISATIPAGAAVGDTVFLVATFASSTYDLGTLPTGWTVLVNSVVNNRRGVLLAAPYSPDLTLTIPLTGATGCAVGTVLARGTTSNSVGTIWRRTDNGGAQALIKAPGIAVTRLALCIAFFCEASSSIDDAYTIAGPPVLFDHLNNPGPLSSGAESLVVTAFATVGAADVDVTWNNTNSQNGQGWQIALYS